MALVTTAGAADADSYATLIEAAQMLDGGPDIEIWSGLTAQQAEYYLRCAAQWMQLQDWLGTRTHADQRLAWPRSGVYRWADDEGALASDEIPDEIKQIQAEVAVWVSKQPWDDAGISELSVHGISASFRQSTITPTKIWTLMRPWLRPKSPCTVRLHRA